MPFPAEEDVRAAIERVVQKTLGHMDGGWTAEDLPNDQWIEFQPNPDGTIVATKCLSDEELDSLPDDRPAEKTYHLRVRVELVES